MAIVRDAVTTSTTTTHAHTCSAIASLLLMFHGQWEGDASCNHPAGVTYAGAPGIFVDQTETGSFDGKEICGDLYYLVGPAAGANNVVWAGGSNVAMIDVSYENVNVDNPIDNSCSSVDTIALQNTKSCTVTFVEGGLGCGFASKYLVTDMAWTSPAGGAETGGISNAVSAGGRIESYEGPSPMLDPETYTAALGGEPKTIAGVIAIAMVPEPPARGRAIKYFYNFWDADPKVRDEAGREIPPNEIRPDNWIEAEGIELPSIEPYDSFIPMPSRSKIVEVNADDRSASIRTDKSQFAEALIARSAAGRG